MQFSDFLPTWLAHPTIATEDILSCFLPLLRETLAAHQAGMVAPLEGIDALQVDHHRLWFEEHRRQPPKLAANKVAAIESKREIAWDVISEVHRDINVDAGTETIVRADIADSNTSMEKVLESTNQAKFFQGYVAWEHSLEHHDPLTDTFSLGLILASLALQLDFRDTSDLQRFVQNRANLFALNPGLHPVLAQAIGKMTELYRSKRCQDLHTVLQSLENYRDQIVSLDVQLALDRIQTKSEPKSRQENILVRLRDRLFDLSRRNPLLHFRNSAQAFNLTHASMPLSIHVDNIREDQLLVWNHGFPKKIAKGEAIRLNQHVNFKEVAYAPSVLERLMADARRDRNEFGCSQLRLVIAFLGWSNLKEKPIESYVSPLLLLPVQIQKQKGIRDTFSMEALDSQAEVNPVIRHLFRQLYNLALPETIDLNESSVDALFQLLQTQIIADEPAIVLSKIERPRIELIHEKAQRRLDQYRRAARVAGRGVSRFENIDYSYDAINYHPLGIRLFTQRVRQPTFYLQNLIAPDKSTRQYIGANESDTPTSPPESTQTVERKMAVLQEVSSDNPYHWTFDLCNLTLVNLHYRRMSLVRDYETILSNGLLNPAFDAAFADSPRDISRALPEALPIPDRFEVVPSDPTQSLAIAEARSGRSYIIQGPPGTGKSQTITNLIADFVANDKRVLFVCEKRSAIDVVYAKLKQSGLGSLCCLVHDSQSDKKDFVLDLKETYEQFLAPAVPEEKLQVKKQASKTNRDQLIAELRNSMQPLERFEAAMESTTESSDGTKSLSQRQLLDQVVSQRHLCPTLGPSDLQTLPSLTQWWDHEAILRKIQLRVDQMMWDGLVSSHPLRLLRGQLANSQDSVDMVNRLAQIALDQWTGVEQAIQGSGIPADQWDTAERSQSLLSYLDRMQWFANGDNLKLLDTRSSRFERFREALAGLWKLQSQLEEFQNRNHRWRQKLTAEETRIAISQAKRFESSLFRWFSPAWWRLRSILRSRYDYSNLALPPTRLQILEDLEREYGALAELRQASDTLAESMQLLQPPFELEAIRKALLEDIPKLPAWIGSIHRTLMQSPDGVEVIARSREVHGWLQSFVQSVDPLMDHWKHLPFSNLRNELTRIMHHAAEIPKTADLWEHLDQLPPRLNRLIRTSSHSVPAIELAVKSHAWEQWLQAQPEIDRFTAREQAVYVQRLEDAIDRWQASNAEEICNRTRIRFLSKTQANPKDAAFSKQYHQGRKILEHEFGKTMRYRPIRDLVDGESGLVVRDLKPVWLMSPLSVSDTLPLDTKFVDVVIFDEASQVRLEDSIPTLFRGVQTIIVGDTMQLPPTNFFCHKSVNEEIDETLLVGNSDDEAEAFDTALDLSSDSLLSHTGKFMESTMLGWHYRSRSESLINFSNWAFYDGRLLTVPDPQIVVAAHSAQSLEPASTRALDTEDASSVRERISSYTIDKPAAGKSGSNTESHCPTIPWLDRPLGFHFLKDGRYEDRRNRREAEHIVDLVADWLWAESGLSLGIIAFSEAQQSEIERLLNERANQDDVFRARYEAELQREENGQFVGLLVKNLENIQGDERDIILLSVCYGPNPQGKVSMNFGPINRDGGEKRLNVAFSRAKQNMIVVSSMHYSQITNDFNLGPNCLKQYLRYVECMSNSDRSGADMALNQLSRWRNVVEPESVQLDPITQAISKQLREQGYVVDNQVGQSHFRIDIAVYRSGDKRYRLGIMIDTADSYRNSDPWERDVMRPRLLRDFGWKIHRVLGKDWYQDPNSQFQSILTILESN